MVAQSLFVDDEVTETTTAPPFVLRLASDLPLDVRISNPHVNGTDDLEACFQSMHQEHRDPLPELTDEEQLVARRTMDLLTVYQTHLAAWRQERRKEGKIAVGTLQKERQSLRCFSTWDKDVSRAPEKWPRGIPWKGLPAGYLASKYFERWIRYRLETGMAIGTMEARWNHLRTVLNMLKALSVIDDTPSIDFAAVVKSFQMSHGDPDDDLVPATYTDPQLEAIYRSMHEPDLRAAWVLGTNCGARSVDLFQMRWGRDVRLGDRPEVYYKARKTGRRHWVPLHPVTVSHLRRLVLLQGHLNPDEPQGLVFPRLTSARAKDPEKSRPARWRNARIKVVLTKAGLTVDGNFDKPWQVLRSTCSSRLNNHRPGSGRLVTHGKDADVNSQHYWDHQPTLVEAIATLHMPAAYSTLSAVLP